MDEGLKAHLAVALHMAWRDGRASVPLWHQLDPGEQEVHLKAAEGILRPARTPGPRHSPEAGAGPQDVDVRPLVCPPGMGVMVHIKDPLPPGIYLVALAEEE